MVRTPLGMSHYDEDRWKARLHDAGLRVTRARLEVIRALTESPIPVSAHDVLGTLGGDDVDRVTVYRTLNSLVDRRLAHRIDPGDRVWRYGLLGDAHDEHAHFVCDACGSIRCLSDATIKISFKGEDKGGEHLKVTQRDVFLHGTCEECAGEEDRPPAAPPPK